MTHFDYFFSTVNEKGWVSPKTSILFVEIPISAFSLPVVKITVNRDFNMDILYSLYDLCIFSHFILDSSSNSVTI